MRTFPRRSSSPVALLVTLRKEGHLRGCIGHIWGSKPLNQAVQQMAVAAATQDSRFSPVTAEELGPG